MSTPETPGDEGTTSGAVITLSDGTLAHLVEGDDGCAARPVRDADELWSSVPDLPDHGAALQLLDTVQKTIRAALPPDRTSEVD